MTTMRLGTSDVYHRYLEFVVLTMQTSFTTVSHLLWRVIRTRNILLGAITISDFADGFDVAFAYPRLCWIYVGDQS